MTDKTIENAIKQLAVNIHSTSKKKGWWDENRNDGECIALMHSELSEALEWLRDKSDTRGMSDHIKDYQGIEEELADVIIRVLDFAEARGLDVAGAIIAKMEYNERRSFKHGGKRF